MTDKIRLAKIRLNKSWDAQGACGSCGWHGAMREHEISDGDIRFALDHNEGFLETACVSKEKGSDSHRGVKIFIGEMTERKLRMALRRQDKLTIWKTPDGFQANALRDGDSGWIVSVDENPLEALKNVLGLNPDEDKFSDLA